MYKSIYYDDLIFITESRKRKTDFGLKKGLVDFLNEMKKGKITIEQDKNSQEILIMTQKRYEEEIKLKTNGIH